MAGAEEKYQLQMVSIFLQSHIKFNISLGKQEDVLNKVLNILITMLQIFTSGLG